MSSKKTNNEKYVRICPRCGSTDVHLLTESGHIYYSPSYTWCCDDCHYQGMMPEIDKTKISEFRKELKKN